MSCCSKPTDIETMGKQANPIVVEFLFLDENVCQPCSGTAHALDEAVAITSAALAAMGVDLKVERIHVKDKDDAIAHEFLTSPTIRISGDDIDPARTEEECGTCGDLAGGRTTVNCRNWYWRGEVYQTAPVGKIVEAIMDAAVQANNGSNECCSGQNAEEPYVIPENLDAFFVARQSNVKLCC